MKDISKITYSTHVRLLLFHLEVSPKTKEHSSTHSTCLQSVFAMGQKTKDKQIIKSGAVSHWGLFSIRDTAGFQKCMQVGWILSQYCGTSPKSHGWEWYSRDYGTAQTWVDEMTLWSLNNKTTKSKFPKCVVALNIEMPFIILWSPFSFTIATHAYHLSLAIEAEAESSNADHRVFS